MTAPPGASTRGRRRLNTGIATLLAIVCATGLFAVPGFAQARPTSAGLATAVAAPAADVLDVRFEQGGAVDVAKGVPAVKHGDPKVTGGFAEFDGVDDAYTFGVDWSQLGDGFSWECMFRYDGRGENYLCSDHQGGGVGVKMSGDKVQFVPHLGGAYRWLASPALASGEWYHVLGTWDGTQARMYLNGELSVTQELAGPLGVPAVGSRSMTLAADTSADEQPSSHGPAAIAAAAVYSAPVTAEQAAAISAAAHQRLEAPVTDAPKPDLLDVSFSTRAPVDLAHGAAGTVHGQPDMSTGVAAFDGVDDAVIFPLDFSSMPDGFSWECVLLFEEPGGNYQCADHQAGGASIELSGDRIEFVPHLGGKYQYLQGPSLIPDTWYHVMGTWDGAVMRLYLNGKQVAQRAQAGPFRMPMDEAMTIGADTDTGPLPISFSKTTIARAGAYTEPLTAAQVAARSAEITKTLPLPPAPQPDVLEVGVMGGRPVEMATGASVRTLGAPKASQDATLGRETAEFDGIDDAYSIPMDWTKLDDGFTWECMFRFDGRGENYLCADHQGGGVAFKMSGARLQFVPYLGGAYRWLNGPDLVAGNWYHAVGTWDRATVSLYVNGVLKAQMANADELGIPAEGSRTMTLAADTGANGLVTSPGPVAIARAAVHSRAVSPEQAASLSASALKPMGIRLTSTLPAADTVLREPVELSAQFDLDEGEQTANFVYTLDGKQVSPSDTVGAGMAAGDHRLAIRGEDSLGRRVAWEVPFTSANIPSGGGVETGQGDGQVTLSARAEVPGGGKVTTTFRESTVSSAKDGFQGSIQAIPDSLVFEHSQAGELTGAVIPDGERTASPTSRDITFQRFDIAAPSGDGEQSLQWTGLVDPARTVKMRVWSVEQQSWVEIASARGLADADVTLRGKVRAGVVDAGTVHVMITGEDPFADDVAPRDASAGTPAERDKFQDPKDYDFAFAHFSDPQLTTMGATGGLYKDFDGVAEPGEEMTQPEIQANKDAYRGVVEWIGDNAVERKIAWSAHTGDLTQLYGDDPYAKDAEGNLLLPEAEAQVFKEFEFASSMQGILDGSGVPNQTIAGNHDNTMGTDTGDNSLFNSYFGAKRYYDLNESWPEGVSYHAWDETSETAKDGQDNNNNYLLFSAGGLDFVAVGLSYGVTQEEADWADATFKRYPDRNGILITHAYIADSKSPDGRGGTLVNDGNKLYEAVVAPNKNVFMVLAGHMHGVAHNVKRDVGYSLDQKHNVVELLADYQAYDIAAGELWPDKVGADGTMDLDGNGTTDHLASDRLLGPAASFLRLLQFDVDRAEMHVDTYSPFLDNFGATEYQSSFAYNGAEDNTALPVDLTTRTTTISTDALTLVAQTDVVIGQDTVESGWPASVTWSGLNSGEVYAWDATSQNAEGETIGLNHQFGGIFVATPAGTDTQSPVITTPAETRVLEGEEFDPLEGVSAVDNTDGDVIGQVTVTGTVDTARPGVYTLLYQVADTNGNQATATRTVTVEARPAPELTDTTVTVRDLTAAKGGTPRLTAQVAPATATGAVDFRLGETLLCSATVTDGRSTCMSGANLSPGSYSIEAAYRGDETHEPSHRSFVLTIKPGGPQPHRQGPTAAR